MEVGSTETNNTLMSLHLTQSVTKTFLVASKDKGYKPSNDRLRGSININMVVPHKWTSFIQHDPSKHTNHPDHLYRECDKEEHKSRNWIKIGNQLLFVYNYCIPVVCQTSLFLEIVFTD